MDNNTYLITGGAGFMGSHIAAELVKCGHKVIIYDNFSSGCLNNLSAIKEHIRIVKGNIKDLKKLTETFKGVDCVLHYAALASAAESMKTPSDTQKVNIEGTHNVLEAARANGVKKVIFASSAAVYGNSKNLPYMENGATDCQSPYAASKLIGEELLKMYHKAYGLQTAIVRYFNVFGPRQDANSPYAAVIAKFIKAAQTGDTFCIDSDGKQSRDFVFIDDAVKATILVVKKGKAGQVYNVASGKTHNLLTLADIIEKVSGTTMKRAFKAKRPGDVKKSAADITKIQKLGYKAKFSLSEGLQKIYKGARYLKLL